MENLKLIRSSHLAHIPRKRFLDLPCVQNISQVTPSQNPSKNKPKISPSHTRQFLTIRSRVKVWMPNAVEIASL
nr:hypothetical protein [Helicobacter pametensis]